MDTTLQSNRTFGEDLDFLRKHDSAIVLKDQTGMAQIIVSAKYQGKVFTSTAEGPDGMSFGWINYKAFDKQDPHMNGYGGEDRLWLGPEGSPFSLFFEPEAEMTFSNWHTPAPFDSEAWIVRGATEQQVHLQKKMNLHNYAGTDLHIRIDRQVSILDRANGLTQLGLADSDSLNMVGFTTKNTLTNVGQQAWDKSTGAPCLWSLGMFTPSPGTVIIVPYEEGGSGKVATTDYFGEIDKDRIRYENGVLLFKADGKSRGKLGIPPGRVKPYAGSYASDRNVLTIARFDIHPKAVYLNQEWTTDKDPYTGDAMNAYNDGPLQDGSQMGPFYELESVSPAAFLRAGASITHNHDVFHFTGPEEQLDSISLQLLGVSLEEVKSFSDGSRVSH